MKSIQQRQKKHTSAAGIKGHTIHKPATKVSTRYFKAADSIKAATSDSEILRYCRIQLDLVDDFMAEEKREFGSNSIRSIQALSAKCVRAARNDVQLLNRMEKILKRYPNLGDDQRRRVQKAIQKLTSAK